MLANARAAGDAADRQAASRSSCSPRAAAQREARRREGPRDFLRGDRDRLPGVDEAHDYKNLQTESNIRDAAIDGLQARHRSAHEDEYLRARHGARVATLATATPIANSITEAHVMQRYLRPDLLAAPASRTSISWAATFGQTVTEIEMAPTGGGNYRMHTRFARFQNVPEMLRMWHVFADVKTAEDLDLPAPAARRAARRAARSGDGRDRGQPRDASAYVAELGERAEQVRAGAVLPEDDNMLKITGDGRKAALDMRLVDRPARQPARASSTSPPADRGDLARASRPATTSTRTPANAHQTRARCKSCSATCPPRGGLERLRRAARAARRPRRAPPTRSATSTRPATTRRRAGCSRPAAPGTSRC